MPRKENQLGLTNEETSGLVERLKEVQLEPGSFLEVFARALEAEIEHEFTVLEILSPPELQKEYLEWNFRYYKVHFRYSSPTLGEGETRMLVTSKREANRFVVGYQGTMHRQTGAVIN
jgi:hypothetical protein